MTRDYAKAVGGRLRAIRIQQGLSLQGVEQRSRGRWKTAAVGSYERGDRMISVRQLSELASFYGVPVSAVLPDEDTLPPREQRPRTVLNLERLTTVPVDESGLLRRWVAQIQRQRDDYAGRVLSIRDGDLRALALLHDTSPAEFVETLRDWGVLETTYLDYPAAPSPRGAAPGDDGDGGNQDEDELGLVEDLDEDDVHVDDR